MFSYEMLDIVNYCKEFNLLFDVGVVDVLFKCLVSQVLEIVVVDYEKIYLCCFEFIYEMLLE